MGSPVPHDLGDIDRVTRARLDAVEWKNHLRSRVVGVQEHEDHGRSEEPVRIDDDAARVEAVGGAPAEAVFAPTELAAAAEHQKHRIGVDSLIGKP